MERFKRFVGKAVNRARLDDPALLRAAGLAVRWLPDRFERFDEMEFLAPLEGENRLVLSFALEDGRIRRMLVGWVKPGDDEDTLRSLDDRALGAALERHGEALAAFMERITIE